jgi:hypothetical protein
METIDTIIEPAEPAVPQPIGYVTFAADGTLDGSYFQVPAEEHAGRMIEVDEETRAAWVNYRTNGARDGLELAPLAAPAPPAVPQSVTMRQARLALLASGKYAGVDAAIDSLPSPQKEAARIEWDYASDVERNSPTVTMLGTALDLDDGALDALFTTAAGL